MAKKGGAHGMTEIGIERSYLKILRKTAKKGNNIARAWLNRDKDNSYQLLKKKIDKCYNKKIGASYKGGKCIICGGRTREINLDGEYQHKDIKECEKYLIKIRVTKN